MASQTDFEYRLEDGLRSRLTLRRVHFPKSPERKEEEAAVAQLLSHLESLKSRGVITEEDERETWEQFYVLQSARQRHELKGHDGEVVVVANNELFFGENLNEAVGKARQKYGERALYSETINMVDYPSIFG